MRFDTNKVNRRKLYRWHVDAAGRRSCLLCHQAINFLDGLHELVSHVAEGLDGYGLMASGHDQQDLQHIVGIPDQIDQMLTAGTADPSKPILDRCEYRKFDSA